MLSLAGLLLAASLNPAKVATVSGRQVTLLPGQVARFVDLQMEVEFVSLIADTRRSRLDGIGEASCLV